MSRRNRHSANNTAPAGSVHADVQPTADSFANFAAKMGSNPSNLQGGSTYNLQFRTRNYRELEAMYRTSWVIRKSIDVIPDDMTREGIELSSDQPDDHRQLLEAMNRMAMWDALGDGVRWSRLYGGAVTVFLIDGQDMTQPLRLDSIRHGQFKGLHTLDRWQLSPALSEVVTEFGPDLGKPLYYDVILDGSPLQGRRIHYSRVARFGGAELPFRQSYTEMGWGQSYIEQWFDRLIAFDSATTGAAQLIHKAHLRTLKINQLREILAGPDQLKKGLYNQVEFMRVAQTIEGLTVLDGNDEFDTNTYNFAGLDDLLTQFAQQLAGATDIPVVRLFGQAPGGLNATGDTDMEMYYTMIRQHQERRLRPALTVLMDILHRSELGRPPEDGFGFVFNTLDPLSETERADIFSKAAAAINTLTAGGILMRTHALRELQQASEISGYGSTITEEDIEDAENDPPPIPDAGPEGDSSTADEEWHEGDHPRDDVGRFSNGGVGINKASAEPAEGHTRFFHGSKSEVSEISGATGTGNIFGGLFASESSDAAASHGDVMHAIDIKDEEILSQRDIDYEIDSDRVEEALRKAMPWLDDEDYDEAYRAVVDDKSQNLDEEDLTRIFREDDTGSASWEAQRIRGVVAGLLGFKAVEMDDEHGTSYLILPGNEVNKV